MSTTIEKRMLCDDPELNTALWWQEQAIAEALNKLYVSKRGPRALTDGYMGTPEASAVFEAAVTVADVLKQWKPGLDRNRFADIVRQEFDGGDL